MAIAQQQAPGFQDSKAACRYSRPTINGTRPRPRDWNPTVIATLQRFSAKSNGLHWLLNLRALMQRILTWHVTWHQILLHCSICACHPMVFMVIHWHECYAKPIAYSELCGQSSYIYSTCICFFVLALKMALHALEKFPFLPWKPFFEVHFRVLQIWSLHLIQIPSFVEKSPEHVDIPSC